MKNQNKLEDINPTINIIEHNWLNDPKEMLKCDWIGYIGVT